MSLHFNTHAVAAIYRFEMARTFRTLAESIIAPVLTTSLYFVVFGAAIGGRMGEVDGVSYGAFIIPGLVMREPIAEPNTTKYSEVDSTGDATLCINVRQVRAISKR